MPLTIEIIKSKQWEKTLDLHDLDINDDDIPLICDYLKEHPEVGELDLSANRIHVEGIARLANIKTIEYLNLNRNFGLRTDGALALAKMKNIKYLGVE